MTAFTYPSLWDYICQTKTLFTQSGLAPAGSPH
jgi:hypothetical protein